MPFAEDLSPFFATADFATQAVLGGQAVQGVFDNGYALSDGGFSGMASSRPTFTLPTQLVPSPAVGAVLVVGGEEYAVAEHQPDGTGVSLLILELAL